MYASLSELYLFIVFILHKKRWILNMVCMLKQMEINVLFLYLQHVLNLNALPGNDVYSL